MNFPLLLDQSHEKEPTGVTTIQQQQQPQCVRTPHAHANVITTI